MSIPDLVINMQGLSMADIGLEEVRVRHADGTVRRLGGFMVYPNTYIINSLLMQTPYQAEIFADEASLLANIPVRLH